MTVNPAGLGGVPQEYFQPTAAASAPADELDKDAFLDLLVTSLRYQDPSEPMSTADLMTQTTQLSTMEQLTALTELSQEAFVHQVQNSAITLVGRTVEYFDGTQMATGVVGAVDFSASPPLVEIDGTSVTYGAVRAVIQPDGSEAAGDADTAGTDTPATDAAATDAAATDTPATGTPAVGS